MSVKTVRCNNYRNARRSFFEFDPFLNIIVGKNGTGKTNILESIIVISNTKSYRTANDSDLIRKGEEFARIILNTEEKEYKIVINKKIDQMDFDAIIEANKEKAAKKLDARLRVSP